MCKFGTLFLTGRGDEKNVIKMGFTRSRLFDMVLMNTCMVFVNGGPPPVLDKEAKVLNAAIDTTKSMI